jgi:hypothetical protein
MTQLKKLWRPETGIFLGIWLVLMVGGRSRFFRDPGTFWHTFVGEQMLERHQLIYEDSFSCTFAGHSWSPHQWLGECVMAVLHRADGLDTLLLGTVTALACLYTWLAGRFMRAGLHWAAALGFVALTLAASSSHFHVRPHIGTIVGMGCTMAILLDFDARRIGIRQMFWLVPVYLLWANIHGGMLGGLGTIAFAVVGWCTWKMLRADSPLASYRDLSLLTILVAMCGLVALVNPYGIRLPQIWLEIMDSPALPRIIQEHAPLDPWKPDGFMVLVFAGLYVFMLVGVLPKRPRVSWLLPLIWLYLACTRVRHAPLFAISAALAIADMLPFTRWAALVARSGSDLFQYAMTKPIEVSRRDYRPAIIPACVVVVAFLFQALGVQIPIMGHGWAQLDATYWPTDLLPDLRRCASDSSDGRPVFNEYLLGGFLIYYTPGFRVFVDDRCELYGDRWLEDYVKAEWEGTEAYIAKFDKTFGPFAYALTRTGSGYDHYFAHATDWRLVRESVAGCLYERKLATSTFKGG